MFRSIFALHACLFAKRREYEKGRFNGVDSVHEDTQLESKSRGIESLHV